jgi:Arc/MetJ family transcription regulator
MSLLFSDSRESTATSKEKCPHQYNHQMMLLLMQQKENGMRTTVTLDDELIADAQSYVGPKDKSALIEEALKALIQREAARRLARLGGSQPGFVAAPRRRPAK